MSCDIGPELQERYHVSLYPLHVLLEGKQYTDGVDIRHGISNSFAFGGSNVAVVISDCGK